MTSEDLGKAMFRAVLRRRLAEWWGSEPFPEKGTFGNLVYSVKKNELRVVCGPWVNEVLMLKGKDPDVLADALLGWLISWFGCEKPEKKEDYYAKNVVLTDERTRYIEKRGRRDEQDENFSFDLHPREEYPENGTLWEVEQRERASWLRESEEPRAEQYGI